MQHAVEDAVDVNIKIALLEIDNTHGNFGTGLRRETAARGAFFDDLLGPAVLHQPQACHVVILADEIEAVVALNHVAVHIAGGRIGQQQNAARANTFRRRSGRIFERDFDDVAHVLINRCAPAIDRRDALRGITANLHIRQIAAPRAAEAAVSAVKIIDGRQQRRQSRRAFVGKIGHVAGLITGFNGKIIRLAAFQTADDQLLRAAADARRNRLRHRFRSGKISVVQNAVRRITNVVTFRLAFEAVVARRGPLERHTCGRDLRRS
ncbi:MAG: hypothetical protein ALAOOOJD_00985 [bacterium]|nr:hypothetical protein [bacterium]